MTRGPLLSFNEDWSTQDTDVWTYTDPANVAWALSTNAGFKEIECVLAANNTARIVSDETWACSPSRFNNSFLSRMFTFEWEMLLNDVDNLDNTLTFFGLTATVGSTRGTANIIGFGFSGDNLQTVVDYGGTEVTGDASAHNPLLMNTYRINIFSDSVAFYINDEHINTASVGTLNATFYINFFFDTEAGANVNPNIGELRAWFDDVDSSESYQDMVPSIEVKKSTDIPLPVRMVKHSDSREGVSSLFYSDITVEYAGPSDTGWTTYTPASSDWVEQGDGYYSLNMGASEFATENAYKIVKVSDDNASSMQYVVRADVRDKTFDEHFDDTGGSGGNTYNIENNYKQNRQDFNDTSADMKRILENLKNVRSTVNKNSNDLSKLKKAV